MLICSIAVLFLAVQISDGFTIKNRDLPNTCGKGDQQVGHRVRRIFLQAHNEKRGLLAEGKVKTKTLGKLPAAANMRFMEYDCGLEEKAINLTLTSEEFRKRSEFTDAEKNFATIESNENNSPSKAAEQAVSDWWERKSHWRNLKNITDGDYEAFPFFLIAQADTDKVGCAVKYYMYDNKFYYDLACFYGKKVEVGSELYREGPKCTNCTGGYECYHALCKKQKP